MKQQGTIRILVPTGHLGTVPLKLDSLHRGVETRPDFVVADAGSGPLPHTNISTRGGRA